MSSSTEGAGVMKDDELMARHRQGGDFAQVDGLRISYGRAGIAPLK